MGSKRQKMDTETSAESECVVCYQVPRAKVLQCRNGHITCDLCTSKVTTCPLCRSSEVGMRNILGERLLDRYDIECSWSERGCEETMGRGQLSAHEDQCDYNPAIVKFCSIVKSGRKCDYKFTPKWLNKPENCTKFLNHVKACLCYRSYDGIIQCGQRCYVYLGLGNLLSKKANLAVPVLQFMPVFCRLNLRDQGKVQLVFLVTLVKVDVLANKFVSFAIVRLTPETTPLLVKFTINGSPSSRMASQWRGNSLPSQSWTQKTICFRQFSKLIETSSNVIQPEIPLPFSLPLSFLSEYYLGEDKDLKLNFTLE